MDRKKIILQITAFTLLVSILWTASWLYNNRSSAVYQRIINQDGYSLSLVKEGISAEFSLKPEWIPEEVGETELDLVIAKKFDSDIVLEKVGKRENDFYIQLNVVPHPNRSSGQLLHISRITNDTFTYTGGFKWTITDPTGKDVLGNQYGAGEGPGNLSDIFIDDVHREKFKDGVTVRYSGYYLYGYQQYNKSYSGAVPTLFISVLVIGSLVLLYRKRAEPEKGLGWRLVGYLLLGGFTFSMNGFRLPLGFAICLLFLRKSRTNLAVKRKAALLGLLLYALQLVVPGIANHLASEPKNTTMRHISAEEVGIDGVWRMVAARTPVSNRARIQSFKTTLSENAQVKELKFEWVEHDPATDRYLHTSAIYHDDDQTVTLTRYKTDEWLQYSRQMMAERFIERVQTLKLIDLKPSGGDHRYVRIELDRAFEGSQGSYAMKDEDNFGVDEKGIYPISDEQLPVTANRMLVCAPQTLEDWSTCEDPVNYYFDIVEGGARE
ncbi:hypothetical protein M3194_25585 [Paenibacillus glycanilyticus]|uniref:hypothetical protein n=1 Tax=Paenibacillus glycanilyticus TaxID=126569 RepID=UPI00203D7161|nr:hypothetical protein [Paenibacillus glycanilyticus]MCM3630710.1 hypothetical protein [Paenibacillus glycanilyticus]